ETKSMVSNTHPSFSSNELGLVKGSILGKHYKVEAFLGEGGFGIVAKCRDTMTNRAVAIKVNKSRPDILQQAKLEIFILEQLRSEVRPILGQLTNALSHLGSVGMVHADLKPGNIMVVNRHESPIKVKLIDFGLACPASAVMPGDRVGTVGYCAPEVMLGLPYNEAIDMWSLGLVAVELATGLPLYPGNEDYDVMLGLPYNEASDMWSLGLVAVELATGLPLYPSENDYDYLKFIIETQGQPPDHVLDSGVYTENYFIGDKYKQQRWTFKTEEQYKALFQGQDMNPWRQDT
uniref:Protein kinase domain-containing protein n=1 Tax=Maylandia zebra TaxID=106582 RepID=A0A3P9CSK7_9CICH